MPNDSTAPAPTGATFDEHRLARIKTLAADASTAVDDTEWGDPESWRGLTNTVDFAVSSYVAATRPSVILALLEERDRLVAEVERMHDAYSDGVRDGALFEAGRKEVPS